MGVFEISICLSLSTGFYKNCEILAKYREVLKCLPPIPSEILLKENTGVFKSKGMMGCML